MEKGHTIKITIFNLQRYMKTHLPKSIVTAEDHNSVFEGYTLFLMGAAFDAYILVGPKP